MKNLIRNTSTPAILLLSLVALAACGGPTDITELEKTPDRPITAADLPPKASITQEKVNESDEDVLSFQNRFDPWIVRDVHQEIRFEEESKGAVVLETIEAKYVEAAKNTYGKLSHLVKNLHPVIREGRKIYETIGPRDNLILASKALSLWGFTSDIVRAWETEIKRTNDRLQELRTKAKEEYDTGWEAQQKLLQDIKEDKILN